ncbi:MAG: hypothetical protein JWL96_583 [Sphingomonas bacterium]|nr:hypothetical protein [Sphingomonas bacterium]
MALVALLCLAGFPARAENGSVAAAVKATYLVKFAHYVAWPANTFSAPTAPLALCIVGHDPFGAAIDAAARDERVDQHPVVVRRLVTIDRAAGCHIAFIAGAAAAQGLPAIDGAPVLSVTDADETRPRGVLAFGLHDGHVGFDVDDRLAARGGLTISSRLLSIAWSVASRGAHR